MIECLNTGTLVHDMQHICYGEYVFHVRTSLCCPFLWCSGRGRTSTRARIHRVTAQTAETPSSSVFHYDFELLVPGTQTQMAQHYFRAGIMLFSLHTAMCSLQKTKNKTRNKMVHLLRIHPAGSNCDLASVRCFICVGKGK